MLRTRTSGEQPGVEQELHHLGGAGDVDGDLGQQVVQAEAERACSGARFTPAMLRTKSTLASPPRACAALLTNEWMDGTLPVSHWRMRVNGEAAAEVAEVGQSERVAAMMVLSGDCASAAQTQTEATVGAGDAVDGHFERCIGERWTIWPSWRGELTGEFWVGVGVELDRGEELGGLYSRSEW